MNLTQYLQSRSKNIYSLPLQTLNMHVDSLFKPDCKRSISQNHSISSKISSLFLFPYHPYGYVKPIISSSNLHFCTGSFRFCFRCKEVDDCAEGRGAFFCGEESDSSFLSQGFCTTFFFKWQRSCHGEYQWEALQHSSSQHSRQNAWGVCPKSRNWELDITSHLFTQIFTYRFLGAEDLPIGRLENEEFIMVFYRVFLGGFVCGLIGGRICRQLMYILYFLV